jgi:hypothetical protein
MNRTIVKNIKLCLSSEISKKNSNGGMSWERHREGERGSSLFEISSLGKLPWRVLLSTRRKRTLPTPAKWIGTVGSYTLELWVKSTIAANPTAAFAPTYASATTTWLWNPSRQESNWLLTMRCKTIRYKTSRNNACAGQQAVGEQSPDGRTCPKIRSKSMQALRLIISSLRNLKNMMHEHTF